MAARPRTLTALLMLGTVLCGLTARFAPLGLPRFAVKYGGSTMWALMIYWVVSALRPAWCVGTAGMAAAIVATAVEFLKRFHAPALDVFRHTLATDANCRPFPSAEGATWYGLRPWCARRPCAM